jgi:hypothetical protein
MPAQEGNQHMGAGGTNVGSPNTSCSKRVPDIVLMAYNVDGHHTHKMHTNAPCPGHLSPSANLEKYATTQNEDKNPSCRPVILQTTGPSAGRPTAGHGHRPTAGAQEES